MTSVPNPTRNKQLTVRLPHGLLANGLESQPVEAHHLAPAVLARRIVHGELCLHVHVRVTVLAVAVVRSQHLLVVQPDLARARVDEATREDSLAVGRDGLRRAVRVGPAAVRTVQRRVIQERPQVLVVVFRLERVEHGHTLGSVAVPLVALPHGVDLHEPSRVLAALELRLRDQDVWASVVGTEAAMSTAADAMAAVVFMIEVMFG
ncbi:hypothetical protein ON010_g17428 [Phytophthora cinnamomi]|nr:hypothetical protein ON010_g17428 [Phytophthora cinnamomi]